MLQLAFLLQRSYRALGQIAISTDGDLTHFNGLRYLLAADVRNELVCLVRQYASGGTENP